MNGLGPKSGVVYQRRVIPKPASKWRIEESASGSVVGTSKSLEPGHSYREIFVTSVGSKTSPTSTIDVINGRQASSMAFHQGWVN